MFLRKSYGTRLNVFAPINDLSALSKSGSGGRALVAGTKNDVAIAGGEILGDEYSTHVVKVSIYVYLCVLSKCNILRTEAVSSSEKGKPSLLKVAILTNVSIYSTLLKSDQWRKEDHHVQDGIRGAINFRQIPGTNMYALGQPTIEAIEEVVSRVKADHHGTSRVIWITLREEPIIYVNGAPYCLRREGFSLRNMKGRWYSRFLFLMQ